MNTATLNYKDLIIKLELPGFRLETASDLAAYFSYGQMCGVLGDLLRVELSAAGLLVKDEDSPPSAAFGVWWFAVSDFRAAAKTAAGALERNKFTRFVKVVHYDHSEEVWRCLYPAGGTDFLTEDLVKEIRAVNARQAEAIMQAVRIGLRIPQNDEQPGQ